MNEERAGGEGQPDANMRTDDACSACVAGLNMSNAHSMESLHVLTSAKKACGKQQAIRGGESTDRRCVCASINRPHSHLQRHDV